MYKKKPLWALALTRSPVCEEMCGQGSHGTILAQAWQNTASHMVFAHTHTHTEPSLDLSRLLNHKLRRYCSWPSSQEEEQLLTPFLQTWKSLSYIKDPVKAKSTQSLLQQRSSCLGPPLQIWKGHQPQTRTPASQQQSSLCESAASRLHSTPGSYSTSKSNGLLNSLMTAVMP